jgi:predicted MPP superfamily phosphohydrolase
MPTLLLVILSAFFAHGWFVEPSRLQIEEEEVPVDPSKLSKPVRILFVSDLHASFFTSKIGTARKLRTIRRYLKSKPVDIVVLGGDFVDRSSRYLSKAQKIIHELASYGTPLYAVLGNHDHESIPDLVPLLSLFEKEKVKLLRNQSEVVNVNGQELLVIGVDDMERSELYPSSRKIPSADIFMNQSKKIDWYHEFDKVSPSLPRLLLSHNPDGVFMPGAVSPVAVLSGHTHGGQVLPLRLWGKHFFNYMPRGSFVTWSGKRLIQGTTLLVSRGFDGSFVPFRFLSRPSILAVTLSPSAAPKDLVIGVVGKEKSGKETVAGMLELLWPGIAIKQLLTIKETEKIRKGGGLVVKVEAGSQALRKGMGDMFQATDEASSHEDESDYVIVNNGTLLQLEQRVRQVHADMVKKLTKYK